ncbi:MAG: CRTAC1 family protein [bacterium]|jgi:hypothetical protein|nr:CRTAC1 family protein [Planctomycetota bacterium]HIL52172.1 CRTAC1 family protein [Planctomycetota bacterium]
MRLLIPFFALTAISSSALAQIQFTDQTLASGLLPNLAPAVGVYSMAGGGAAAGDFNRDGWQDLFVIGNLARPDRLFINKRNGTFEDQAAAWGVQAQHDGRGVCVGDYDGDGWLDVFITSVGTMMTPGEHKLYHNEGGVRFTEVALAAGVNQSSPTIPDGFGAAFGDYDLDGQLDLFVTGWIWNPAPSAGNRLFHNLGGGLFQDTTLAAGISPSGLNGFAPRFVDMDGDRYPELLVAADFMSSRYFHNNTDGTFSDLSVSAGTSQETNGMGQDVGDVDNDGDLDWYVTSIYTGVNSGNKLYINQGGNLYREGARESGTEQGYWGWSAVFGDLDLDGWLDLVETNGWSNSFSDKPACVWHNNGDYTFTEMASQCALNYAKNGLGLLRIDYDNDGDLDFLFTAYEVQNMRLFRNDTVTQNNWLRVFLQVPAGSPVAPHGFGAKVRIRIGNQWQMRSIDGGCHYLTQSELSAHFGLGTANVIDEMIVEWPDGTNKSVQNVRVNRTMRVRY